MSPRGPILIVDDDRDIREGLKDALESQGYGVVEAIDGLDALEQLRAGATLPKLILLDLMMPRMDGMQVREEMSKVDAWSSIPVIIMTADSRARRESFGDDGFLRKPVPLKLLLAIVARTLDGASA